MCSYLGVCLRLKKPQTNNTKHRTSAIEIASMSQLLFGSVKNNKIEEVFMESKIGNYELESVKTSSKNMYYRI